MYYITRNFVSLKQMCHPTLHRSLEWLGPTVTKLCSVQGNLDADAATADESNPYMLPFQATQKGLRKEERTYLWVGMFNMLLKDIGVKGQVEFSFAKWAYSFSGFLYNVLTALLNCNILYNLHIINTCMTTEIFKHLYKK